METHSADMIRPIDLPSGDAGAASMEVVCPRCGYDLSGVVQSWESECPVRGQCSECGLDVEWAEVVSPKWLPPAWSIEHARYVGVWGLLGRGVRGVVRAMWPWALWRGIPLGAPVVVARLPIVAGMMFVAGWMAMTIVALVLMTASVLIFQHVVASGALGPGTQAPGLVERLTSEWATWAFPVWPASRRSGPLDEEKARALVVVVGMTLAVAPSFVLMPVTMIRQRVRWVHVARAAAWGMWVLPVVCAVTPLLRLLAECLFYASLGGAAKRTWQEVYLGVRYWGPIGGVLLMFTVTWAWWAIAVRAYMKIRHPRFTAFLLTLVAWLIVMISSLGIPGMFRDLVRVTYRITI